MATIPLAQPKLKPEKLNYPAYLSEKVDGVPVIITINNPAPYPELEGKPLLTMSWMSRQGKLVPSIMNQVAALATRLKERNIYGEHIFVAEVTHKDNLPFKQTSGIVRRVAQCDDLILNFFDYARADFPAQKWIYRHMALRTIVHHGTGDRWMRLIKQYRCDTPGGLVMAAKYLQDNNPSWEGLIARSNDAAFKPDTRHWDYQKIVTRPTMDLRIVDVLEATSEDGEPLGMAGRLIAEYPHEVTIRGKKVHREFAGVGPGKMTHEERKELWEHHMNVRSLTIEGRMAQVSYKRDKTYGALREPTFQCWRDDKDEVNLNRSGG